MPERYTHALDVCDALYAYSEISEDAEKAEKMKETALKIYSSLFDTNGILSEKSAYYEGDRYTYSFRASPITEERISVLGGKEKFASALDDFFGFTGESVKQITHVGADSEIDEKRYHRFQGFNNECDMECPYSYILAGRHDRFSEINRELIYRSFGLGSGALPGNNDSGGLTSLFVFAAIGLFPIAGGGDFLIGSPCINGGKISLSTGKILELRIIRESEDAYDGYRAVFCGKEVADFKISKEKLLGGGLLEIYLR